VSGLQNDEQKGRGSRPFRAFGRSRPSPILSRPSKCPSSVSRAAAQVRRRRGPLQHRDVEAGSAEAEGLLPEVQSSNVHQQAEEAAAPEHMVKRRVLVG